MTDTFKEQLSQVQKKNIKISNQLKDISKDILILTEKLDFDVKKNDTSNEKEETLKPAGISSFVLNPSHVHFTSTLRRWW